MRICVLLIVLCVLGCCRAATARDLGTVDSHRKVECGFAITNTSDKVWKVNGARSSCACMSVSVQQGEMKPGEVRPVAVSFDPAGMEGPVEKVVQVDLKPGKSVMQTYKANVRRRLGLDPQDAAFGVIRRTDTGRTIEAHLGGYAANAVITAIIPPTNSFFDVTVGSAHHSSDRFAAATPVDNRADRTPRSFLVRFKTSAPLPGTYAETWRIRTSDPEIPEIAFPVSARIADGFTVTPQVLTIGWNDSVCSRSVVLRPESGHSAFRVLSAETRPRKWGDVKIVPRPLGGWQISIDGIDPVVVRQFSKKPYLRIETDMSKTALLSIPLEIRKQGGGNE